MDCESQPPTNYSTLFLLKVQPAFYIMSSILNRQDVMFYLFFIGLFLLFQTDVIGEAIGFKDMESFHISDYKPVSANIKKDVPVADQQPSSYLEGKIKRVSKPYQPELMADKEWGEYVSKVVELVANDPRAQEEVKNAEIQSSMLSTVEEQYAKLPKNSGTHTVKAVQGVDAKMFPLSRYAKNAIQQVASQFNFLESTGPNYMPLIGYVSDKTQGPQASIGALEALVKRDYAVREKELGRQPLFGALPANIYKGGYLMLYNMEGNSQKSFLDYLKPRIGELRILAQESTPEFATEPMIQVFTAAPSFQGAFVPLLGSTEEAVCKVIVSRQYRTTAQLAAIRSQETGKPVNLHLTLVGQGAFNNPESVMIDAFKEVFDIVKGFNVNVFIHGYSSVDIEKIKRCANNFDLETLSKDDFLRK